MRNIIKILYFPLIAIFIAVSIRLFWFEIYSIPSNSMSPEVMNGDYVLSNKICYGSRMPFYGQKDWDGQRLLGDINVSNGDIVVFNLPHGHDFIPERMIIVKRCIGLPGDALKMEAGVVARNSSFSKYETQRNKKIVSNPKVLPYDTSFHWNEDNFGPLIIPKKGNQIKLTKHNLAVYDWVLKKHEGNNVEVKDNGVFINGRLAKDYIFKNNYYFMLGDNRHESMDSRYWGFVPENHIIGKAALVLWSRDNSKPFFKSIRWDRFLKKIE